MTKREITIRFVTASPGAKLSSFIGAISALADDVAITCKVLSGPPRTASITKAAITRRNKATELIADPEPKSKHPQLAYSADPQAKHNRYIDVEASLKKLDLTREELLARVWPKGSPQHRLKRAAAHKLRRDVTAH